MRIDMGSGEFDADPSNSIILSYPNELLDGMYVDLDDRYAFLSAYTEGWDQLKEQAISEGIPLGSVSEGFDEEEYPHLLVIKAVGNLVLQVAEQARELPLKERSDAHNRELSLRDQNGVYVRLGWLPVSNTLWIHYIDEQSGEDWKNKVPNNKGNDAFTHPNSYKP